MQRVLVALSIAGCGRWGFDATDGVRVDGSPGGTIDASASLPAACDPRLVAASPLPAGEVPIALRATPLSTGHAIAIATDQSNVYVLRVDGAGAVVSQHLPFGGGYRLLGMSQLGDRPMVFVETGGVGYIKLLSPDWDTYVTGPGGDPAPIDPPLAALPGGTTLMTGLIAGGVMSFRVIDGDGADMGIAGEYTPAAVSGSLASTPNGARAVVDVGDGTCETFAIRADGVTGGKHRFGPCAQPVLAAYDELTGAIAHQTSASQWAVHAIPADPLAAGVTISIGAVLTVRIATIGGEAWIADVDDGGGSLVRIENGQLLEQPIPGLSGPFDLTPSAVFWLDGVDVRIGDPCLR